MDAAARTARTRHRGQRDRAGKPYVKHLERIVHAVAGESPTTQAAAWLHDAIEDTLLTRAEIAAQLGEKVASTVDILTRVKKEAVYREYIDRIITSKNRAALLIKIEDLCDHALVSTEMLVPSLARRYLKALKRLTAVAHRRAASRGNERWTSARWVLEEIAGLADEPGPENKAQPATEVRAARASTE